MRAWKEGRNFRELVSADDNITNRVPSKVIQRAFDLKRQLRNVDAIFARVFGSKAASGKRSQKR
jgi:adenylosuccinate lyase